VLDPALDGDGRLASAWPGGSSSSANAVVATASGRMLVAGQAGGQLAVIRYTATGSLHTKWGGTGRVVTSFPGGSAANAIAVQPDGKVVAAGSANSDFAIVRYRDDGRLDTSFGVGGKVTTDFAGRSDSVSAVALLPDGKILVAGQATITGFSPQFAMARYLPDGALDPAFGTNGKVVSESGQAMAMRLQPDGKIVLGGIYICRLVSVPQPGCSGRIGWLAAAARFTSAGAADPGFANSGLLGPTGFSLHSLAGTGLPGTNLFVGLGLTPDGKVVAGGYTAVGTNADFVVARLNNDGSPDPEFGASGVTRVDVGANDVAAALAIQNDGRIVLAGQATSAGPTTSHDFAALRLTSNGSMDTGFGNGGVALTDFGGLSDAANAVAIQATDGRILLAGRTDVSSGVTNIALARYLVS
jgi:uncharacterized delta-60 repeat protein